jgi:hypothetical protein
VLACCIDGFVDEIESCVYVSYENTEIYYKKFITKWQISSDFGGMLSSYSADMSFSTKFLENGEENATRNEDYQPPTLGDRA